MLPHTILIPFPISLRILIKLEQKKTVKPIYFLPFSSGRAPGYPCHWPHGWRPRPRGPLLLLWPLGFGIRPFRISGFGICAGLRVEILPCKNGGFDKMIKKPWDMTRLAKNMCIYIYIYNYETSYIYIYIPGQMYVCVRVLRFAVKMVGIN